MMSYLRLSSRLPPVVLLSRTGLATGRCVLKSSHQIEYHHRLLDAPRRSLLPDSSSASVAHLHSASTAKPHMTKSLLKWKKRKRKSKAQQQKEMANLQRDLIKLLTKRAIQVVQNKSLLNAHREVVTCHALDYQGLHDYQKNQALVDGLPICHEMTEQPWYRREHKSSYIARTVEANLSHVTKQHQVTSDLTNNARGPNSDLITKCYEHIQSSKDLRTLPIPGADLTKDRLGLVFKKPITYSDVFHSSSRLKKQSPSGNQDFISTFQKFSLELAALKKEQLHTNLDWDSEVQPEGELGESLPVLSNTPAWDPSPKTVSSIKTEVKPSVMKDKDLTWSSSDHQREQSNENCDSLYFSKDIEANICSERTTLLQSVPSLFVHDPIEPLDDTVPESLEHKPELLPSSAKKKRKNKKLKKSLSHETDLHGAALDVMSLDGNPENLCVSQEIREMLDESFVEACCFTNSELLAVRNLQYHATKHKVTSVHVFNVLIQTLAKKGDLQTIKSLFLVLRQQGLEPTLQTYAACLECVGRMHDADIELCKNLISDIKKSNLDLADIAIKCYFQLDEWDHVMKAIKMVEPDFTLNSLKFRTYYDNKLLLGLNKTNHQAIESNQYAVDSSHKDMMQRAAQQLDMEVKSEVKVKSIAAADLRETLKPQTLQLRNDLLTEWRKVLSKSFEEKTALLEKNAHDNINMTLYPFLKLFPKEEYVNVIFKCLKELLTLSAGYSPTLSEIKSDLGWAVNRKFNTALRVSRGMDKKVMAVYQHFMAEFLDENKKLDNHRLMWKRAMSHSYSTMNLDMSLKKWPRHIIREIGKFLLDMILYDLRVNANTFKKHSPKRMVPAFSTMVTYDKRFYTNAELKLHPVISRLFAVDNSEFFSFTPCVVPMLVPPVPWVSRNTGGLLLGSNGLVRMRSSTSYVDPLKTVKESRYSAVLDSLNTLSACAWQINKPVLDLQIEVFNNKGDSKLKVASPASQFPPLPVVKQTLAPKEKALLYRERLALQQKRQDAHGLWCTDLYRLSIANKFRDETFWFPHSMDFRGRTYPLPPHFNHLGSDNVRGMLLFAKGKPLGEEGYDWLKIHLINLTGLKKRSSNAERLEYADQLMEDILDSADNPLTGKKWWQESDEPWQTLACCMEIAKIERYEGNKADYLCHFPVHQDGSCNGLQHYAAIGRDQAGAESVNLYPFDVPKDVYSNVVDLVEKARQADAEEGNEIAKVLEGHIKRKVIKQTIMTTVYGVTRYGAREQIYRQLKDIGEFSEEESWKGSMYLTDTTFSCLREIFTAARDIQDWLTEASSLISIFMPVDWVTPLGLPVLQPYFKRVGKHSKGFDRFKPNAMKQKNAFPPNYIHSLDSTHMMLTALHCVHAGITFVSVHDCYWTHACDVPIMNRICREQFVSMHKQPLLEDLSEHLVDLVNRAGKDPKLVRAMEKVDIPALLQLLQKLPKRGSFDMDNVLQSTYFFS